MLKTFFWQCISVIVHWRNKEAGCVSVRTDEALWELKKKIQEVIFLDANNQELVLEDRRLLGDDLPISSFGITNYVAVFRKFRVSIKKEDLLNPIYVTADNGMTVEQLKLKALNIFYGSGSYSEHCYFLQREGQEDMVLDNHLTLPSVNVDEGSALNLVFKKYE